jgi:hypothetical protein
MGSMAIAPICAMNLQNQQNRLDYELILAAIYGNLAQATGLIDQGADAGYVINNSENFTTALIEVARYYSSAKDQKDRLEIVKLLIKNGANVNAIEPREGITALILTVSYGTPATVQALIEAGADLEHRNTNGETALMRAISLNKKDTMLLLLTAIRKLTEQEKQSIVSWLNFNKDLQGQGKAFLTKDPRTLVTNDIIESLAMELKKRAIRAGVQDAVIAAQANNKDALAQQLRQYLDLNFLKDLVIKQSKISRK